jgi:hypothetical protein
MLWSQRIRRRQSNESGGRESCARVRAEAKGVARMNQGEAEIVEIDEAEAAKGCEEPRKLPSALLK